MRGGEAFFGVLGAVAFVGAEDQEGLGAAAVDRGDEPVGRVDLVELGKDFVGELVGGAQRPDGGGGAAEQHDQHAADQEALPHAEPQPRRVLVSHAVKVIRAVGASPRRWDG